jgi:hypothetical protein
MGQTIGYTLPYHKRNTEIVKELQISPITDFI